MRHPLMIMMTMASALSQWVIRTVRGCTITFETRCKRPAAMSVTDASRCLRVVDRRKSRRFERRFRRRGLDKRHKRSGIGLRIAGLRNDIFDWRLVKQRQGHHELEAGGGIGRIDDPKPRLVGRNETDHTGGAFGDGNSLIVIDRDADPA